MKRKSRRRRNKRVERKDLVEIEQGEVTSALSLSHLSFKEFMNNENKSFLILLYVCLFYFFFGYF